MLQPALANHIIAQLMIHACHMIRGGGRELGLTLAMTWLARTVASTQLAGVRSAAGALLPPASRPLVHVRSSILPL